jgi:hypothetical protein
MEGDDNNSSDDQARQLKALQTWFAETRKVVEHLSSLNKPYLEGKHRPSFNVKSREDYQPLPPDVDG